MYCSNNSWPATLKRSTYDALVLGTLIRGASTIGIWPPPSSPYTNLSWRDTLRNIRGINVTTLCEEGVNNNHWNTHCAAHGVKASIVTELEGFDDGMEGLELAKFQ